MILWVAVCDNCGRRADIGEVLVHVHHGPEGRLPAGYRFVVSPLCIPEDRKLVCCERCEREVKTS